LLTFSPPAGLSDGLIPTGSSIWYYEQVRKALGYPADLDDTYRLFTSAS